MPTATRLQPVPGGHPTVHHGLVAPPSPGVLRRLQPAPSVGVGDLEAGGGRLAKVIGVAATGQMWATIDETIAVPTQVAADESAVVIVVDDGCPRVSTGRATGTKRLDESPSYRTQPGSHQRATRPPVAFSLALLGTRDLDQWDRVGAGRDLRVVAIEEPIGAHESFADGGVE